MKLIIGNKNYSSWSLRGWLATKQSGLHFDEITVPIMGEQWSAQKHSDEFQPSSGKVPILWDGDNVIWDSLAIMEYLGDKVGPERFWPKDANARGMARSLVAEMHSSYAALRAELPMNVRRRITLDNMLTLTDSGAIVLPAMPGYYHQPRSIADLVDFVVSRICDQLEIPHQLSRRWGENP